MNQTSPPSGEKTFADPSTRPNLSDSRPDDLQSAELPNLQQEAQKPTVQNEEAASYRTTFFVNVDWSMGSTLATAKNIVGQMYVEGLEPLVRHHPYPIILIHGDFHTGQTTKPDGQPGWASFFLNKGFQVFIVDLPPSGRSNFLTTSHYIHREAGVSSSSIPARGVESSLTAPGVPREVGVPLQYAKAKLECVGDPIFAKYCASLETLHLNKVERQSLAQNALQALLRHVGKSILVGEGSGGAAAWLATDVEPDLVAGAIVLEPPGPPFGTACPKERNPYREYTPFIQYEEGTRIYGLTDIPLTYDPPTHPHGGYDHPEKNPLDITQLPSPDGKSECFVQSPKPRKLINIKKVPNAVVTAHASSHGMYDWATVVFMLQAGVKCDLIKLEEKNILGNGHLMFLETNSNEIAQVLMDWISENAIPASFQKLVSEPTPPPEFSEFVDTVERLSPQREASVESISSRKTQLLDSQSMDQEMSLVRLPETPQPLCELENRPHQPESSGEHSIGNSNKRAALSSGQTTISISNNADSPYPPSTLVDDPKRRRIVLATGMSTPSSASSTISSSQESSDQTQPTEVGQVPPQQIQTTTEEKPVYDISLLKPTLPGGVPSYLKLPLNKDNQPWMASPALSLPGQPQASGLFNGQANALYEHFPIAQQINALQRDYQRSFTPNKNHTTARFECQTGSMDKSIATTMYDQKSHPSGLAYPGSIPGSNFQSWSPIPQAQQQGSYPQRLGHSPALNGGGGLMPVPTSTPTGDQFTTATLTGPYNTLMPPSTQGSHFHSLFGTYPQITPPSPSPAPRPSSNPPAFNLSMGSPAPPAQQKTPASK
ncbi:Alpha/Beta hydrolase fold [Fusarium oxysporum f. sp. vasinfectum]|nr:Alpha/Beta hydrolase fold [Fusarium oxysporum f. sp. vasinfectum]